MVDIGDHVVAMVQSVWQRRVSAHNPAIFDPADGILELHACTLKAGAAASTLRCSVGGAASFALGRLTDSRPCSLKARLEASAVLTCEGEALLTGVLHPVVVRPRRQWQERELAGEAEDSGGTPPVSKALKSENGESASVLTAGERSGSAAVAAKPSYTPAGPQKRKAEKALVPLSHRVLKSGLEYDVLKPGRGNMAARAKQVYVRYEGKLASTGYRFDAGVIKFRLGLGEVIRGWDEGIQGMLIGECRRLFVPARLGYGNAGAPPEIPPNAGLTFEVELLDC